MGDKGVSAGGWKRTLAAVLRVHGRVSADGAKAVSYATLDKRSDVLFSGFRELRALGYRLNDVHSFREAHMQALARHWEAKGQSPSTIQNKVSVFRTFAEWIGKRGMIQGAEKYVSNPAAVTRHMVAQTDKTWSGAGVDIQGKIAEVQAKDPRVTIQLELQRAFGLRAKEAMLLKPHMADKGSYLAVNWGTKGGRDRVVPIDTPAKREVLERAKTFAATKTASTSDPARTLAQWRNHYYHVCRSVGISREGGIVSHGLRHEHLNARYRELTGQASPIQGGDPSKIGREEHRAAMQEIAELAGHSRAAISTAYVGSQGKG